MNTRETELREESMAEANKINALDMPEELKARLRATVYNYYQKLIDGANLESLKQAVIAAGMISAEEMRAFEQRINSR